MDISEKYIKMCKQADDIQKDWEPQVGDWFHDKNYPGAIGIWQSSLPMDTLVWLPSEERLEQMHEKRRNIYFFIEDFIDFMCDNLLEDYGDVPYTPPFRKEWEEASMQQLRLAFLMSEKYGKFWDNDKEEWMPKRLPSNDTQDGSDQLMVKDSDNSWIKHE
ncbi:MAG: hypothetical protein E3J56_13925 [Candidatus Aminicenantes bacterium]|nr:MAG: hypothetical protein E3J56_13925 [Candidatus Aminicenantes bacterium]